MCDAAVTLPKSTIPLYCKFCDVWLHGDDQWENHIKPSQRLHRNNLKRAKLGLPYGRARRELLRTARKGVVIPLNTVYLIEPTAIYEDAIKIKHYTLSVYQRVLLRARL